MDPKDPQNPAQPAADPTPSPADPTPPANPNEPAPPDPGTGDDPAAPAAPDDQQPGGAGEPTPTDGTPKGMPRGERRIRQLSDKVKQGAGQPYQQPSFGGQPSPQFPQYQPGQEVPADQLQRDVVQTASAIAEVQVNRQLQQRDAVNNFERDQENLPTKFDELNPDKPDFTPELDEAIAQEYQERAFKVVGYDNQGKPITQLDPSVRLSAIAERHVKAARGYAARISGNQRTATAAAADTTAPKPGGAKPADRKFEDLSLDEMRKKVGYHKI